MTQEIAKEDRRHTTQVNELINKLNAMSAELEQKDMLLKEKIAENGQLAQEIIDLKRRVDNGIDGGQVALYGSSMPTPTVPAVNSTQKHIKLNRSLALVNDDAPYEQVSEVKSKLRNGKHQVALQPSSHKLASTVVKAKILPKKKTALSKKIALTKRSSSKRDRISVSRNETNGKMKGESKKQQNFSSIPPQPDASLNESFNDQITVSSMNGKWTGRISLKEYREKARSMATYKRDKEGKVIGYTCLGVDHPGCKWSYAPKNPHSSSSRIERHYAQVAQARFWCPKCEKHVARPDQLTQHKLTHQ